jgi:hypothetical protein
MCILHPVHALGVHVQSLLLPELPVVTLHAGCGFSKVEGSGSARSFLFDEFAGCLGRMLRGLRSACMCWLRPDVDW